MTGERGAASALLLAVALVAAVLGIGIAAVGQYLAARSQAAAAADAAALAAAPVTFYPYGARGTPGEEAARFAAVNGARLVLCVCPVDRSWTPRRVTVMVSRDVDLLVLGRRRVHAVSRAEFIPPRLALPGVD